jgi:hypothetical protein
MPNLDIANGFYVSFSPQMANLECKNLRPFVPEAPAYSTTGLRSTDGILLFKDTLLKTSRGAVEAGGVPYFVQDDTLCSLAEDGTQTNYTNLPISGTGRVSMAASATYIYIVVPGGNTYYFDYTATKTIVNAGLDPNFLGPADTVVYYLGFFFFSDSARTIIFSTDADSQIAFTATSSGTAEVNPDPIQAVTVSNGQFYAIGTETIQPYSGSGGSGFPLSTIPTATVNRGMSSRFGFAHADNDFFFIGGGDQQEAAIWRFNGGNPVKISTPAIDNIIQSETNESINNAFAWSYMIGGEEYVGFSFNTRTFVYQVYTSAKLGRAIWHERATGSSRWRANTFVRAYNRIFIGDDKTEKIGTLEEGVYTEYGDTVHREFSTQPFSNNSQPFFSSEYEMIMATGVANDATSDPQLGHQYSDNGVNFSAVISRSMGAKGDFSHRVVYRKMGRVPRQRVMKFFTDEPCETTFFTLSAKVKPSSASD